jgi:phosphomannomutase
LTVLQDFDYVLCENGLVAYQEGSLIGRESIQGLISEDKIQKFINFCLEYMSKTVLPVKRGTFIEFRNGVINVCPPGRSCNQLERSQFIKHDKVRKVYQK